MYRLVLEKHRNSDLAPAAILGLAGLLDRKGDDAEAAALYEQFTEEHPQAGELDAALYQWAWTLVDLNQSEKADAIFTRLVAWLNRGFARVVHVKPPASRKDSSEKYLVATGFRGRPEPA